MTALVAVAALIAGQLALARPAAAAEPELLLSLDGHRWSTSVQRDLFDASRRWVPGDTVAVPVWVRNTSDGPARVRAEVVDVHGSLVLGRDVVLTATVGGRPATSGSVLVAPRTIDDQALAVVVTAAVPVGAGNLIQRRSAGFRLRVSMGGEADGALGAPLESGQLSATGAPAGVLAVLVLGAGLVGTGLLARRRERRPT